jgi:hypothetical protein
MLDNAKSAKPLLYGSLAGILLGIPSILYLSLLSDAAIAQHGAVVLAGAGAVYVGFGFADDKLGSAITESIAALVFWAIAILGALYFPLALAIGFFAHALWDIAHHPNLIKTEVRVWFPPFCAVYDCLVGAFLLLAYLN